MSVSIVIPWCNRPEIVTSLKANSPSFDAVGAEVILINGSGNISELLSAARALQLGGIRLLDLRHAKYFNKAQCINIGVNCSINDWIFMLDADIVLPSDFFPEALKLVRERHSYLSVKEAIELDSDVRDDPTVPRGAVVRTVNTNRIEYENGEYAELRVSVDRRGTRNAPGMMLVRKNDFVEIGGANSQLFGWGFEDLDVQIRLQLLLGLKQIEYGKVTHLSHKIQEGFARSAFINRQVAQDNYYHKQLKGSYVRDTEEMQENVIEVQLDDIGTNEPR